MMILLRTSKTDFEQDYDIVELKQFESVNVGEYVLCENASKKSVVYYVDAVQIKMELLSLIFFSEK